jgi:16S rRNA (guanine966-N2)-methyltransferase
MRIIAGIAKGTPLETPRSGTRPMTGRARESVFSIVAARLPGSVVLDLFAGSGSLGLESLSRGAESAVFVELNRSAAGVISANIERVGLGGTVVNASAESAIPKLVGTFDLVFVDPPYADDDASVGLLLELLDPCLADDGLVVMHRQAQSVVTVPDFLTSVDERHYGDAVVTMMERIES